MNFLLKFVKWWVTPRLPEEHIFISPENRPKGISSTMNVYFRKWVIHPIKRRTARYYLKFLQRFFGIKVIAITGSAGKTTTKEMTASILRQKGETVASFANIDPVYNIPTTILSCKPSTKYLVLEMGVEFPGEMDFYLWLARPDIAVVTNVYPTHTQFFGNAEGVAKEKGKLVKFLNDDGIAILNRDNIYTNGMGQLTNAKLMWFGKNTGVKASNVEISLEMGTKFTLNLGKDKISARLPILGQHFAQNAVAAASTGHALGCSMLEIKRGLERFDAPDHRMKPVRLKSGAVILDDSYNNNPQAAAEALETFEKVTMRKQRVIVFGDMLELGKLEEPEHKRIGELIGKMKVDYLMGIGSASKKLVSEAEKKLGKDRTEWADSWKSAIPSVKPLLSNKTAVLVKGSRSVGLDQLVSALL